MSGFDSIKQARYELSHPSPLRRILTFRILPDALKTKNFASKETLRDSFCQNKIKKLEFQVIQITNSTYKNVCPFVFLSQRELKGSAEQVDFVLF
jgi:hypothetical protein